MGKSIRAFALVGAITLVAAGCIPPPAPPSTTTTTTAPSAPCQPGTYSTVDGNEPCEPAPPGNFVDIEGALEATPCPPGSFQPDSGQTTCELAPIGSYVEGPGATEFSPCPDGSTTGGAGASSIEDCTEQPPGLVMTTGGLFHTCALLTDGTARCWGDNQAGQLGDGTNTASATPVQVAGLTGAIDIVAGQTNEGGGHTCALIDDGSVRCWGGGGVGQLGNGARTGSNVPVPVTGLTDAIGITAGPSHTCALIDDGSVRCWGANFSGQIGNGESEVPHPDNSVYGVPIPVPVSELTDAVYVTAGDTHTCAVLADGTIRCWGMGFEGGIWYQGGIPGFQDSSTVPIQVTDLTGVVALTAGFNYTCALLADGGVRCWGQNSWGNLGDGTTASSRDPVAVVDLTDAVAITSGGIHTCALVADGTARCWGDNQAGQLGDGTNTASATPVHVASLSNVAAIGAGRGHTCAVDEHGTARCWGWNPSGQLGDGSTNTSNVPVAVAGLP